MELHNTSRVQLTQEKLATYDLPLLFLHVASLLYSHKSASFPNPYLWTTSSVLDAQETESGVAVVQGRIVNLTLDV